MALAPLPTTATRFPARATEWSHRAECQTGPANRSIPSIVGQVGSVELSAGEDDGVGLEYRVAFGRGAPRPTTGPDPSSRVTLRHGGAEAEVGAEAEPVDQLLGVGEDLALVGEPARPSRGGGEGERVEVGGHVAAAPRIGVVPPGAPDPVGLLDDGEVRSPARVSWMAVPSPERPPPTMTTRGRARPSRRAERTARANLLRPMSNAMRAPSSVGCVDRPDVTGTVRAPSESRRRGPVEATSLDTPPVRCYLAPQPRGVSRFISVSLFPSNDEQEDASARGYRGQRDRAGSARCSHG